MPNTRVTTLLAVRDGADFLPEQLDSLAMQDLPGHRVLASDDGSSDASPQLLQAFAERLPLRVIDGPRKGFARNFLHLIAQSRGGDFLAFADQDDVWLPGKLSRAVTALGLDDGPALYCSRRWIWDARTNARRLSRAYPAPPGFGNALVENIAPGNTIVLNPAAADLARRAAPVAGGIYAHDWWLYQIVSGAGGRVIHDPEPTVLYRQHQRNALGAGEGARRGLALRLRALGGAYRDRVGRQIAALQAAEALLSDPARRQLDLFARARSAPFGTRLHLMRAAGVYRNGHLANLALRGAMQFGRV